MIRPLRQGHRLIFVALLALPPAVVVALWARPQFSLRPTVPGTDVASATQARLIDTGDDGRVLELRIEPALLAPDPLVYALEQGAVVRFLGSFNGHLGRYSAADVAAVRVVSGVTGETLAEVAVEQGP